MLPDTERIQPNLVGELDLFEQVLQPLHRSRRLAGSGIRIHGGKAINANLAYKSPARPHFRASQ